MKQQPRLTSFRYTIIDEADEMLESDWADELGKIMGGGGEPKFTLPGL